MIEQGVVVLLDNETTGLIPVSASLSFATMQERFLAGAEICVYISASRTDGEHAFALSPAARDEAVAAFDREFDQLNHVLTNCSSRVEAPRSPIEKTSVEEQIEEWIDEVEDGLGRLRKHRGKRLSEEF